MTRVASLYVPGTFAVRTATTAGQRGMEKREAGR